MLESPWEGSWPLKIMMFSAHVPQDGCACKVEKDQRVIRNYLQNNPSLSVVKLKRFIFNSGLLNHFILFFCSLVYMHRRALLTRNLTS